MKIAIFEARNGLRGHVLLLVVGSTSCAASSTETGETGGQLLARSPHVPSAESGQPEPVLSSLLQIPRKCS